MTAAERKALAFFAAVGVLGVGARVAGVGAPPPVALPGDGPAAERSALAGQLAAVDSARAERQARGRGAGTRRSTDGASGGRRRRARAADSAGAGGGGAPGGWPAAWPLGSWAAPLTPARGRADTRARVASAAPRASTAPPAGPVDADRADSAAFERLPGVGPALAGRLVADRRARGPFGSLAGLSRVRGVGPALEVRLAPLVTFSSSSPSP